MGDRAREADEFCATALPGLVGVLTLYCGCRDTAEEVAQDVIVRALATWPQVRNQVVCRGEQDWVLPKLRQRLSEFAARQEQAVETITTPPPKSPPPPGPNRRRGVR